MSQTGPECLNKTLLKCLHCFNFCYTVTGNYPVFLLVRLYSEMRSWSKRENNYTYTIFFKEMLFMVMTKGLLQSVLQRL